MAKYYRPPGRNTARSVALTSWANGILLTTWPGPVAYNFNGTALVKIALPAAPEIGLGFSAAIPDNDGNAWLAGYYGGAMQVLAAGGGTNYPYPLGAFVDGVDLVGGQPYFLQNNGGMMTLAGGAIVPLGTASFGEVSAALATDGSDLYVSLPVTSRLGMMTLAGRTVKVAASAPAPGPLAGTMATAGWHNSVLVSGANALAATSQGDYAVGLATSGNTILLLAGPDPNWRLVQSLAGTGSPSAAVWTPNEEQVLITDPVNGVLAVYGLVDGLLPTTPSQTLALPGAGAVAIFPSGDTGIVCQPASNMVRILTQFANVWSLADSIAIQTAPNWLLVLAENEVVASYTPAGGVGGDGLIWIDRVGLVWGIEATVTGLGFGVSGIASDGANIYAAGTTMGGAFPTTGNLAVATKAGGILARTAWNGTADWVYWEQAQIAVGSIAQGLRLRNGEGPTSGFINADGGPIYVSDAA